MKPRQKKRSIRVWRKGAINQWPNPRLQRIAARERLGMNVRGYGGAARAEAGR
jgi:hypothetical protein